ncbi:MAG: DegT/DnrJ/EryC1/StrS family aminotransferase [Crocosphaera sp.]|nr:DegT/DnrJ/EryC1/StrS family aminotransferase [Crocosphaera sp.]
MQNLLEKTPLVGHSQDIYQLVQYLEDGKMPELQFEDNMANRKLIEVQKSGDLQLKTIFPDKYLDQEFCQSVPFLPQQRLLSEEEYDRISDIMQTVLKSGQFTSGPFIELFAKEVASFTRRRHVVLTASGTMALLIALCAMEIGPDAEVIMPANSFAATENAVLAAGATPVLIDINPNTYNLDPKQIEALITPRTRAIIPVHLYGNLADIDQIWDIANQYKIEVIADAAQSFGISRLGEKSTMSILSFNPFKNFGACGKGGAIVTDDEVLANLCHQLSYHGFARGQKNVKVASYGYNARMDNFQAATAFARFPFFTYNALKRSYLAYRYIRKLKFLVEKGVLAVPDFHGNHTWHLFTVRILGNFDKRKVQKKLFEQFQVETSHYYPILTHHQNTVLKKTLFSNVYLPNTEAAHKSLLHLPLHNQLTLSEQNRVLEALYAVLN